jgi:hypothetical protein
LEYLAPAINLLTSFALLCFPPALRYDRTGRLHHADPA